MKLRINLATENDRYVWLIGYDFTPRNLRAYQMSLYTRRGVPFLIKVVGARDIRPRESLEALEAWGPLEVPSSDLGVSERLIDNEALWTYSSGVVVGWPSGFNDPDPRIML